MQQFFHQHGSEILSKGFEHLYISGLALIIGIIIAVPLGVLLTRFPKVCYDCDWLNQRLTDNPFSCFIGIDDPAIWRR